MLWRGCGTRRFHFPRWCRGGLLAVWLGALLAAWAAAQRCGLLDALVRCRWQLLAIVVLAVACAQFFVGLATRQTLTDDYGSVVNGALLYAQQGKSAAFAQQYQWYLNHWPNNRGIFFLLALFFRVLTALGFGGQWYTGMVCLATSALQWLPYVHSLTWAVRSVQRRRLLFCRCTRCLRRCTSSPAWRILIHSLSGRRLRRCFCGR